MTRDDRPPTAPTLTSLATTASSITVGWFATGDDESIGTATAQDLRYLGGSACPIGPSNFSTGALVQTGAPGPAGTPQSAQVSGLIGDTPYCFLLRVTDKASNSVFSEVLT